MLLKQLKEHCQAISGATARSEKYSFTLQDIRRAYQCKVLDELSSILFSQASDKDLAKRLKTFLADNWSLINGTILTYTAMPQDQVSILLCQVAEFVGEQLKEAAITVLIPGIKLYGPKKNPHPVADVAAAAAASASVEDARVELDPELDRLPLAEVLKRYILVLGTEGVQLQKAQTDKLLSILKIDRKMYELNLLNLLSIPTKAVIEDLEYADALEKCEGTEGFWSSSILSVEDLQIVLRALPDFRRTLFLQAIRAELPRLIQSAKNFTDMSWGLTEEQVKIFFRACNETERFWFNVTNSAEDLGILEVLPEKQGTVFLQSILAELPELIQSAEDFKNILQYLTNEQRVTVFKVCNAQEGFWLGRIRLAKNFRDVLEYLTYEQRVTVFKVCNAQEGFWLELIQSAENFSDVLEYLTLSELTDEQSVRVFNVCNAEEGFWLRLIKTAKDLENVVNRLTNPEQIKTVYDACQAQEGFYSKMICSVDDFEILWKLCSSVTQEIVFPVIQVKLPELIADLENLKRVLAIFRNDSHTAPERTDELLGLMLQACKTKLPELINSAEDLRSILQSLRGIPEAQEVVITACAAKLHDFIQSVKVFNGPYSKLDDIRGAYLVDTYLAQKDIGVALDSITSVEQLRDALQRFPKGQDPIVRHAILKKSSAIILSAKDFSYVLKPLDIDERAVVVNTCNAKPGFWLDISRSAEDLIIVLQTLVVPPDHKFFIETIRDKLPTIIQSAEGLSSVLKCLEHNERALVFDICHATKRFWLNIILLAEDLRKVMDYLSLDRKAKLFDACHAEPNFWLTLIRSQEGGLQSVLTSLDRAQCTAVLQVIQERLSELIQSAENFVKLFSGLDQHWKRLVFEICHANTGFWSSIIRSAADLRSIIDSLSIDEIAKLFDACDAEPGFWLEFIRSKEDLPDVFPDLRPHFQDAILNAIRENLPGFISHANIFARVLRLLKMTNEHFLFNVLTVQLPMLIQSADNFSGVFSALNENQRTIVFKACHAKLGFWFSIIGSVQDLVRLCNTLTAEEQLAVSELIVAGLLERMQTVRGLQWQILTVEEQLAVSKLIVPGLPEHIQTVEDLQNRLQFFREINLPQSILIRACTAKLPQLIQSVQAFETVLSVVDVNHRFAFIDAYLEQSGVLRTAIVSMETLRTALQPLPGHQRIILLSVLQDRLPDLIRPQRLDDLLHVFAILTRDQVAQDIVFQVCHAQPKFWPRIIRSADDLNRLPGYLTQQQQTAAHTALRYSFLEVERICDAIRFAVSQSSSFSTAKPFHFKKPAMIARDFVRAFFQELHVNSQNLLACAHRVYCQHGFNVDVGNEGLLQAMSELAQGNYSFSFFGRPTLEDIKNTIRGFMFPAAVPATAAAAADDVSGTPPDTERLAGKAKKISFRM